MNKKNNNRYKIAQIEQWYNENTARTTQDPEILKKILERGNNDVVSCYAALNPHCPLKALSEVLKRGKDDDVSWYAADNPHCPPETKKIYSLMIYIKQNRYTRQDLSNLLKQIKIDFPKKNPI